MPSDHLVALIMAAGRSRRFGQLDKRVAQLSDGRGLLANSVARASEAFPQLRVVLRMEDDMTTLGLPASTPVIRATRAERGLGASLGEAITALDNDKALADVEAVAILLGDMPYIRLETFHALRRLTSSSRIVRPRHAGQPGHPVCIGRDFWQELAALDGDEGARSILQRHPSRCDTLKVDDPSVQRDIDVIEDILPPGW